MPEDVRWKQRFDNFLRAFSGLQEAMRIYETRELSKLEKQGLIQGFEYTHELAWNTLKDYLSEQGIIGLIGSKDSVRSAFRNGLISNGEAWMDMIKARNLTSHTYDEAIAENVTQSIINSFYPVFLEFAQRFKALSERGDDD
jgi:nucleotidyltransferase substrate binding protein (TIGR01987 family)